MTRPTGSKLTNTGNHLNTNLGSLNGLHTTNSNTINNLENGTQTSLLSANNYLSSVAPSLLPVISNETNSVQNQISVNSTNATQNSNNRNQHNEPNSNRSPTNVAQTEPLNDVKQESSSFTGDQQTSQL